MLVCPRTGRQEQIVHVWLTHLSFANLCEMPTFGTSFKSALYRMRKPELTRLADHFPEVKPAEANPTVAQLREAFHQAVASADSQAATELQQQEWTPLSAQQRDKALRKPISKKETREAGEQAKRAVDHLIQQWYSSCSMGYVEVAKQCFKYKSLRGDRRTPQATSRALCLLHRLKSRPRTRRVARQIKQARRKLQARAADHKANKQRARVDQVVENIRSLASKGAWTQISRVMNPTISSHTAAEQTNWEGSAEGQARHAFLQEKYAALLGAHGQGAVPDAVEHIRNTEIQKYIR